MRSRFIKFIKNPRLRYGLLSITLLVLVWQLFSLTGAVPSPLSVFGLFFRSFVEPVGPRTLPGHVLASLKRVMVGFSLATVLGVIAGIAMGRSKAFEAIFKPLFEMLRPIPTIAWIPLAILWFGIYEKPKYFIIFIGAFVTITVNAYDGAKRVDDVLMGAALMLGAKKSQLFGKVVLPSCVPPIFAGLQVAMSGSWMSVLGAEMIRSEDGCGWLINAGMQVLNIPQVMAGMISIGLVGLMLVTLMRKIEENLCRWNYRAR